MTSTTLSTGDLEDLEDWVESYADTTGDLSDAAVAAAVLAWLAVNDWYDEAAIAALAAQMAAASAVAQQETAGATAAYIAGVFGILAGAPAVGMPSVVGGIIRNGAPADLVHRRPAYAYRRAIATGATHQEALEAARIRAAGVTGADLSLARRDAEQQLLEAIGVSGYRRILRPELSRTGSCGLCIAAADRIYSSGELMPIHPPSCNCVVMPIIGAADPGLILNRRDVGQLYDDAGGTGRQALSKTRYSVNQHGEYGPVLTRQGDNFRGPDRARLEDDPARAASLLAKAAPVLQLMRNDEWEGPNPAGALAYQESFVDRLDEIVRAA